MLGCYQKGINSTLSKIVDKTINYREVGVVVKTFGRSNTWPHGTQSKNEFEENTILGGNNYLTKVKPHSSRLSMSTELREV